MFPLFFLFFYLFAYLVPVTIIVTYYLYTSVQLFMFGYTKSHLFRIKLILMISIDFHPCIDIHRFNQSSQLTKLASITLSFILYLLYFTIFFPHSFHSAQSVSNTIFVHSQKSNITPIHTFITSNNSLQIFSYWSFIYSKYPFENVPTIVIRCRDTIERPFAGY